MPLTAVGTPASATANITTGEGTAATSLPNTVNGTAASQLRSRIGNAPSPLGNMRYGAGHANGRSGPLHQLRDGPYSYSNGAAAPGYQTGQWPGIQNSAMNQGAGSWSANYPASAYRGAYPPNYYGAGNYANSYAPSYGYSPSQYGPLPNGPQTFANGSRAGPSIEMQTEVRAGTRAIRLVVAHEITGEPRTRTPCGC